MAEDRWYSRALPILEAVATVEGTDEAKILPMAALGHRIDETPDGVLVEVERLLESGYLAGELKRPFAGDDYLQFARLGAAGARAVGAWPSTDPYEALLVLLERRVAEAPDEETRSKWRRVRDTIRSLGGDVGSNLIAGVLIELGKAGL
ncbi:MAG TPA: hypothetical protein VHG90_07480 [Acidimicrobiales bacterium]|nr:hypothetical protein [Acidimicrobiales bacterium]